MRAQRRSRPAVAVLAVAAAMGLVLGPAMLHGAHAAFSATTANDGNALAADQLQPPSGLTVAQSCTSTPTVTHLPYSGATGTTSVSVPPPTGTTTGNLLVAQIAYRDGAETITAPSGWTLLTQASNGTLVTSAIYWKAATSTEPTAVFSRPAGSTGVMAGGVVAFTGARLTAPAVYGGGTGTGATATTPSLTTTGTTVEVVDLLTKTQEYLPTPAGTTTIYAGMTGSGAAGLGLTAADQTFPGPGAIPVASATSTTNLSSAWLAQTVVLRRVAGTPSATLSWTASPSTWASGYLLAREVGGTAQATQTVSGVGTTGATQNPLVDSTSYTFRLTTYRGSWRSSSVTAPLTTNC